MGRTLVLGDIHGAYKALLQVFERSGFNRMEDRLICLGDVADRNPDVKECFEEILRVKDLIYILGNHDWWLLDWLRGGEAEDLWLSQGGRYSIESYHGPGIQDPEKLILRHRNLLENARYYYIDRENRVYVHGGFHPARPIHDQRPAEGKDAFYLWDRDLFELAYERSLRKKEKRFDRYLEIFVGHTSTLDMDKENRPLKLTNLWALDQGAGWGGKLTLMDADTHEYWQSDPVSELYPK